MFDDNRMSSFLCLNGLLENVHTKVTSRAFSFMLQLEGGCQDFFISFYYFFFLVKDHGNSWSYEYLTVLLIRDYM